MESESKLTFRRYEAQDVPLMFIAINNPPEDQTPGNKKTLAIISTITGGRIAIPFRDIDLFMNLIRDVEIREHELDGGR